MFLKYILIIWLWFNVKEMYNLLINKIPTIKNYSTLYTLSHKMPWSKTSNKKFIIDILQVKYLF